LEKRGQGRFYVIKIPQTEACGCKGKLYRQELLSIKTKFPISMAFATVVI